MSKSDLSPGITYSIDNFSTATEALNTDAENVTSHLLNMQAREFEIAQGQQELLSVEEIKDRIKLLDHQMQAAHRALFKMSGGALFADEVGLGKTLRWEWFSKRWISAILVTPSSFSHPPS